MTSYSLSHVSDQALLRDLSTLIAKDRATTAQVLAHIAEVDARRLFLKAGYPSMHAYCVGELHLSGDAAYRRIHAARAARECPALFTAIAEGRLHLTAVNLLAPRLGKGNASDLIAMATHRRKDEIERGLAERFPTTESLPIVEVIRTPVLGADCSPAELARVESYATESAMPLAKVGGKHGETSRAVEATETAEGRQPQLAPARVAIPPAKVAAIAAERYLLSVTLAKSTYDNLRYAQELLSHRISFGDVAQVLDRALQALVRQLEKQKFAATEKPRPPRRSANARHIPAHVRREAKKRDDGRCTFVSETGHRCEERSLLEFDHIEPVGRGGKATVENVRLRCRAHNQYEAERTFGVEFMREKRAQAFEARQTRS